MKQLRHAISLGILALAGSVALLHPQHLQADNAFSGGSYLTTVKDANGNFASRGVITLHADHTMSVIDSGQGGPFLFSSQLGSWKFNEKGVAGRTIDFDFPPNAGAARLDYTISFSQGGNQVTGTITLIGSPRRRRYGVGHVYLCGSVDQTLAAVADEDQPLRRAASRSVADFDTRATEAAANFVSDPFAGRGGPCPLVIVSCCGHEHTLGRTSRRRRTRSLFLPTFF